MASLALLPDPNSLHLLHLGVEPHCMRAVVATTALEARCPVCQRSSNRVHSRYQRLVADLPWAGWAMRLCLHVRRFFCDNLECQRGIFAERLPQGVAHDAKRTFRLLAVRTVLGFALGVEPLERLLPDLGESCGRDAPV